MFTLTHDRPHIYRRRPRPLKVLLQPSPTGVAAAVVAHHVVDLVDVGEDLVPEQEGRLADVDEVMVGGAGTDNILGHTLGVCRIKKG